MRHIRLLLAAAILLFAAGNIFHYAAKTQPVTVAISQVSQPQSQAMPVED